VRVHFSGDLISLRQQPACARTLSSCCVRWQLVTAVRSGKDKDSIWVAVRIGSLTTFLREFQALHCLQYSRYAGAIFQPRTLSPGSGMDYGSVLTRHASVTA
jgi:hypothetical protein